MKWSHISEGLVLVSVEERNNMKIFTIRAEVRWKNEFPWWIVELDIIRSVLF